MDTMYPSVRYYRIWHPTEGRGKGWRGVGGIVHGIESLRFCSGTDPSDERRSRLISSFSILPIVEKQTASRDAMKLSRLASGEWRGGKKKKKRWRLNNKTRLFRLVACTLCPFSVFSFRDGKKKKRLRLSVFRNPFPHVKRIRRQEWRRSLEERDSPSEEDTVSFNFFFFPPGSTRFQKPR